MKRATQFLKFDRDDAGNSVPVLELDELRRVLSTSGERKVAIISSCGAAKQGKSFILNFILRSLLRMMEDEDDLLDWENPDEPLQGFEWGNGGERTTEGMWISEPELRLKNSKDEQLAVFLVDSQGIFDEFSNEEESHLILGLSLLLSTTTVFSMRAELQEEKLVAIANTIERLQRKCPIQLKGLMILVKDWTVQQECTHGEQGGADYLAKRLAPSRNHSKESKYARKVIQENCKGIRGFLSPHPTENPMKTDFRGSLNEISAKFARTLEAFLLNPSVYNVEAATENGMSIVDRIHSFMASAHGPVARIHNTDLTPTDTVEALAAEYNQLLRGEVSDNGGLMGREAFEALHVRLRERVISKFEPSETTPYKESRKLQDGLERSVADIFNAVNAEMETTQRDIEVQLCSLSEKIVSECKDELLHVDCDTSPQASTKRFTSRVNKVVEKAVQQFASQASTYKPDLVEEKQKLLKATLADISQKHAQQQKIQREEKENATYEFKKVGLLLDYRNEMKKFVSTPSELQDTHKKYVEYKLKTEVLPTKNHYTKLGEAYEDELAKLLQFLDLKMESTTTATVNIETKAEVPEIVQSTSSNNLPLMLPNEPDKGKVLTDACQRYIEGIQTLMATSPSQEDLESFHRKEQGQSLQCIEPSISNPLEKVKIIKKFQERSNREYFRAKEDLRKRNEAELQKLMQTLRVQYEQQINVSEAIASTEDEFQKEHRKILEEIKRTFAEKCTMKNNVSVQRSIDTLTQSLEELFIGRIFGAFTNRLKATNILHGQARLLYSQLMDFSFKSTPFLKPVELEQLHEMHSRKVINKLANSEANKKLIAQALKPLYERYRERNDMNTPGEPAIGIDLGTTYCCAAIYQHGKVSIIKNELGKNTIPSFVAILPSGELLGETAKLQAHETPKETIFDAKRLIGRRFQESEVQKDIALWPFRVVNDDGVPKVQVNGRTLSPEVISAKILKHIKNIAETYLKGTEVKNAVITVPAYFNDGQRQATRDAAEIAGLTILQIINEPTAAAIAYHLHRAQAGKQNVLVYDLGGGTFDVSVLSMTDGRIEVKAVGGDTHLGGEDFDQALVNHCVQRFRQQTGINLAQGRGSTSEIESAKASRNLRRLRNECENRKKDLSSAPSTVISVASILPNLDLQVPLSRAEFEQLNMAKFSKTITVVEKALADAKLRKEEIHEVVLVGGSTRIPKIQDMLTTYFNGKKLCTSVNADEAVAYGAAIQASILNGSKEQELQGISLKDVIPLSLGVEVHGGAFSKIINRNTAVPAEFTKPYVTVGDFQTTIHFKIFEGEDRIAARNHTLGNFVLHNIPSNRKGVERVQVTMRVDTEGILHVKAVCESNKAVGNITIDERENKGRLTIKEIQTAKKYLEEEYI